MLYELQPLAVIYLKRFLGTNFSQWKAVKEPNSGTEIKKDIKHTLKPIAHMCDAIPCGESGKNRIKINNTLLL